MYLRKRERLRYLVCYLRHLDLTERKSAVSLRYLYYDGKDTHSPLVAEEPDFPLKDWIERGHLCPVFISD